IKLISFGGVHPLYDHDSIVKTGPYTFDDIHQKLKLNKIDVILIPSVCSETFSFTTREAIETGIPTACFPIGGQYDQVKHYDKGIIVDDFRPESFVHAIEEHFKIQEYEEVPMRNPVS
ncbi:MAG TPA: glycosyltransferase, partial [Chitinophagaceae bacterium]|nr:glycosyltransferase [Chitinophagaceae bacterium]